MFLYLVIRSIYYFNLAYTLFLLRAECLYTPQIHIEILISNEIVLE